MTFYATIAHYYSDLFPLNPNKTSFSLTPSNCLANQTAPIISACPLFPCHYLDLGCSTGDLARSLAKVGHQVVALDSEPAMIEQAQLTSSSLTTSSQPFFQLADMQHLSRLFNHHLFDQVLCFGNTLVHLTEPATLLTFFKQIRKQLTLSGCFKGQILNYLAINQLQPTDLPVIETQHLLFKRHYQPTGQGDLWFDIELFIKDQALTTTNRLRLLPLVKNDLDRLLAEAGFNHRYYYADFNRHPFTSSSYHLVFEATL